MRWLVGAASLVLLGISACSRASSTQDEEAAVFLSVLKFMQAHPPLRGAASRFEERMLKKHAVSSYIIRSGDIYGYLRDDFFKGEVALSSS